MDGALNFTFHVALCLQHAFAAIAGFVAVAEFHRLGLPVDAPEGTLAVAVTPFARVTVTANVGLPRESKISSAWSFVISDMMIPLSRPRGRLL